MSTPLRFTLLLYSAVLAVSLSVAALIPEEKLEAMRPEPLSVSETQETVYYTLRAENGELCIFEDGELVQKTGVSVSSLPKEDRFSLEAGITASSREALASLLEDLCS